MEEEMLLTPQQVADKLQVNREVIYKWLRSGKIKGKRVGRLWRVTPAELERFLE